MALTRTDSLAAAAALVFLGLVAGESALVRGQGATALDSDLRGARACGHEEEPFRPSLDTYFAATSRPSAALTSGEQTPQSERENR